MRCNRRSMRSRCPSRMRRGKRQVAFCVAALAGLAVSGVAYGRPCGRQVDAAGVDPPSVLILMDASKSMAERVGGGGTRLDAAKRSLRTLVDGLPDDARVGLRLYGHRVAGAGRAAGCRDTELVSPVGTLDRAALKAQIDAYRAVGSTPIGRSLRAAATDLPASGQSTIVLVSDGGDNCAPPDPCRVAEQIAAAGRTVSIQSIGFRVSGHAREQLRCIAAHAHGVYRSAENAQELAVALRALSARAMRTFRPAGRRVTGGSSARTATPIGAGSYLDVVQSDQDRWYSISMARGQRLAVSAVVVSPCPVEHDLADAIGTRLVLDVADPAGINERTAGTANLFMTDESLEGTGLLTEPIGPKPGLVQSFARPGRYGIRVLLSDNGLSSIRRHFGDALPLQLETRLIGGAGADRPVRRAIGMRSGARETGGASLALIAGAAIVLGALAGLALAALRRRSRS
jgi:Ca-activated chloride channel family protein